MPTNHYRFVAMEEFGKQLKEEEFTTKEMVDWCNTYRTKTGRLHKQTGTTLVKMHGLLKKSDSFVLLGNNTWKYIGENKNEQNRRFSNEKDSN